MKERKYYITYSWIDEHNMMYKGMGFVDVEGLLNQVVLNGIVEELVSGNKSKTATLVIDFIYLLDD